MKTNNELKTSILNHLTEAGGRIATVDFLDLGSNAAEERQIGRILREMHADDQVRLVAASDLGSEDAEDLARVQAAIPAECEWFMTVALV